MVRGYHRFWAYAENANRDKTKFQLASKQKMTTPDPNGVSNNQEVQTPEILRDIPEELVSKKLLLRCPLPGDGPIYFDFANECFEDTKQWFGPWAKDRLSAEQCEELVRKMHCEFLQRVELNYLCFLKDTNELVGRIFVSRLNWTVPRGMLGYWTRPSHQRHGLGTEAVDCIKQLVFKQLLFQRLEIHIDPQNQASQQLAKKCGFILEGQIRNCSFDNFGSLHDNLSYSLIPSGLANIDS